MTKIKRANLLAMLVGFQAVGHLPGKEFSNAIVVNKRAIIQVKVALDSAISPSKGYQKYDAEREDLCKAHCDKDVDGNPILIPISVSLSRYSGIDGNKKFEAALATLRKKHNSIVKIHENKLAKHAAMLEEEIDFDFFMVAFKDVPDLITPGIFELLSPMILSK